MNNSAIKTFAPAVRRQLMEAVKGRDRLLPCWVLNPNGWFASAPDVKETFQTGDAAGSAALEGLTQSQMSYEKIDKGRNVLFAEMLEAVKPIVPQYGIEVIDIIPRQIKYSDELTESVFNRMIKERNQIAQAFRSYGEGQKAKILGKLSPKRLAFLGSHSLPVSFLIRPSACPYVE